MKYRAEIDGLRAIAVVPVILFHAGFELFGGGFVGVDIFFVISGYLITTILIEDFEKKRFSIIHFYERRARRIIPALFLVTFACVPFAWLWLMPSDMKDFSQSLVATALFASNFLFWLESGYFESGAELKPLLHVWSLAVEEQYYLVFPPLLILFWRLGQRWMLFLFGIGGVLSLALAQWASVTNPSAAFYMLPTRGWELMIGVLLAIYLSNVNRVQFSKSTTEIGGWLGVLLILTSIFAYSKTTPFPGFYALVPTIGTAMIILFAEPHTSVGRLIGRKCLVAIGLISYSAYLWHQPLFAFARHNGLSQHDKLFFLALCALVFVLAYLSWNFIERPFRDSRRVGRTRFLLLFVAGTIFLSLLGIIGHIRDGDVGQLSKDQKQFLGYFENDLPDWKYFQKIRIQENYRSDCSFYDIVKNRLGKASRIPVASISESCFTPAKATGRQVFVWGDSNAQQLYYGLNKVAGEDFDIMQVASSGCAAEVGASENNTDYCEYSNWFAFNAIKKIKPKYVFVGQDLGHDIERMNEISSALLRVGVGNVIFVGPTPHWVPSLPSVIAANFLPDVPRRIKVGLDEAVLALDKHLAENFVELPNVRYISLIDYFCRFDGCTTYYGDDVASGITTWDDGHLTPIASYWLAKDVWSLQLMR